MALNTTPSSSYGILQAIKGSLGLFGDTNKAEGTHENATPTLADEYESKLSEAKINELTSSWKKTYAVYFDSIDKSQKLAFDYWIGKQKLDEVNPNQSAADGLPTLTDNLIFPALETFLPIATRANPDPLVQADPTDIGQFIAKAIKVALTNEADRQKLRRKLAKLTRGWALNRLGSVKLSWNAQSKEIETEVINSRRLILDKDGHIDEGGWFTGEYIGEKKKDTAEKLSEMFPKKRPEIIGKCHGKMGTKIEYYEWWYRGTDLFFTMDEVVLGKFKNPHWNYDGTIDTIDPQTGSKVPVPVQGTNHFKKPMFPYLFLSIFSSGLHPHDDTSLIIQNVTIQDNINSTARQIAKNVAGMNNGLIVSGKSFTEEQASGAAAALRRGTAIRVPDGNVRDGAMRFPPSGLPADVFNLLKDMRQELANIFGTSGSTPQGTQNEETVRGKIMSSQQDSSRIGGGITEQIEQVADSIYNYWVQMFFVYFDEEHFILDSGSTSGQEILVLKNAQFPLLKSLNITVKEGSLIPKDPMTQRNEAVDLWSAGVIDPLNFYKKLDFADPTSATQSLMLWQMYQKGMIPPQAYLPSFQIGPQGTPQPAQAQPPPPGQPPSVGQPQPPAPQSQPAVQAQESALIKSVPLPR